MMQTLTTGIRVIVISLRRDWTRYPTRSTARIIRTSISRSGWHPSGPNFYINKIDNTLAHGLGGGLTNDGKICKKETDPCFDRLVDGSRQYIGILVEIDQTSVNSGQYPESEVLIRSAKVSIRKKDGTWRLIGRDKIVPLPVYSPKR
jgi:hypothetical protein